MSAPEGVPLPPLDALTDTEAKKVYVGLNIAFSAWHASAHLDPAHEYLAALMGANVQFVLDELDRRGVPRDTFPNVTPGIARATNPRGRAVGDYDRWKSVLRG